MVIRLGLLVMEKKWIVNKKIKIMKSKYLLPMGVVLLVLALFYTTSPVVNNNVDMDLTSLLSVNSANAECEVEVKVGFVWVTVLKCDDTPNETCSDEYIDDNGDTHEITCDGKEL